MTEFYVADMTCGHCVAAIGQAIREVDPNAYHVIELEAHRVRVHTDDPAAMKRAIEQAGYTAELTKAA